MSTISAPPSAPNEIDFSLDVETIAAMVQRLSEDDRTKLHKLIGVRRAATPRTPKPAAEQYQPNTGDPRLDTFMLERHDPGWKPAKAKAPTRSKGPSPTTAASFEREAAAAWRRRGYAVMKRDDGWVVLGDGDGTYQRQMTAAYVQTSDGWKHPDNVEAGA